MHRIIKRIILLSLIVGVEGIMVPFDGLKTYKNKRDFSATPEPSGKKKKSQKKNNPIFVIQKHRASHLHYDFRIEMEGVLKSWAVPKGPSLNPEIKRLAVLTENHPMDYANFEGNIPEGHYGAGEVIVWDNGTFENIKKKNGKIVSLPECFKNGQIEISLSGKKLQGKFALVRMSAKKNWLLIKMHDQYADSTKDPIEEQPGSVISNKTIESLQEHKAHQRALTKKRKINNPKKKNNTAPLTVGRYTVELTNQQKLLFGSASKITKGDLIDYYNDVAPVMMRYVKNRAIAMQRFPQGVSKSIFFQKEAGDYFPEWITRYKVHHTAGVVNYPVIDKNATLVYLANQAAVPHIWLSRVDSIEKPDRIIFDLDPSPGLTFTDVQYAAKEVKKVLDELHLPSFYMLTGSRGAHIVIPIKRNYSFDQTRDFAHEIAQLVVERDPKKFTTEMNKKKRGKRVFIDWLRNGFGATAIAPYAVRALPNAPVAMPVTWQELCKKGMTSKKYTIKNVRKRLDSIGDVWLNMQKSAVSLTQAQKLLKKL